MEKYIGVEVIKAKPMTLFTFNEYRGFSDELASSSVDGYLVEYEQDPESPNKNHPDHEGYISWSPKNVFEKAYRRTDGLTFGLALEALKLGKKVARAVWEDSWKYIDPNTVPTSNVLAQRISDTFDLELSEDILAEDWYILEPQDSEQVVKFFRPEATPMTEVPEVVELLHKVGLCVLQARELLDKPTDRKTEVETRLAVAEKLLNKALETFSAPSIDKRRDELLEKFDFLKK